MIDEEEHSESECYYPDELVTNEGNSQEEFETLVKEQKSENTIPGPKLNE